MNCTASESTLYLNLLNVLPLGYALPSLLAYLLIFYIILRHYRTAFYVLFVINGLLEITLWSTNYFKARLSAAPWVFSFYETLGTTGASVSIFFFINYSVPFAAKGTNLLLTLNRLTLIRYNKTKHNRIWKWLLPASVVICLVVPCGISLPILLDGATMTTPGYRQAMYSVASVFLLGLPTFGLNVAIAYSLLSHRRKRQGASNQASDPVSEAEMKLCIMTGVMFLTNVVGFVCQVR
ncbi:SRG-40 protein [Aphelenchoides avenae]|nr:SRG-40 protein [Aphelenchus avenae]